MSQIALTPPSEAIVAGDTVRFRAQPKDKDGTEITGLTIIWSTSDTSVAVVTDGLVTAKHAGGTSLTASVGTVQATASITVSPAPVARVTVSPDSSRVVVGSTVQLTSTPTDAHGTALTGRTATWSSSAAAVADVSASGLVTTKSVGVATITATVEGKSGTAVVTVRPVPVASVVVTPASASPLVGQTLQLSAVPKDSVGGVLSGRPVTWTSSDTTIATVVSYSGLVTTRSAGAVTITATVEGTSATAQLTVSPVPVARLVVSPATASVYVGQSVPLTATTLDSAGNPLTGRSVAWSSGDATLATISATGVVTARAAGTVTLTATSEGKSGTASVTVSPVPVASVVVTPTPDTILVGQTLQLTAATRDSTGAALTGRTVSWASSDATKATVSPAGVVTGVAVGSVVVTATSEGKSGTAAIVVKVPIFPAGTRSWVGGTGGAPTDWFVPTNWSPINVPTASDTAIVNAGAQQPALSQSVTVAKLVLGSGATIATAGHDLTVGSGLVTQGSINGGGAVIVTGGASQLAGAIDKLRLRHNATATLTGMTSIADSMVVGDSGSLALSGHRLAARTFDLRDAAAVTLLSTADTLDVQQTAIFRSVAILSGKLMAGVIRVSGAGAGGSALAVNDNFVSTGTQVVLTGSTPQLVATNDGSRFQNVLIDHTGPLGTFDGTPGYGVTLQGQGAGLVTYVNGSLTVQRGQLNLGSPTLVGGSFASAAGTSVQTRNPTGGELRLSSAAGTTAIAGAFRGDVVLLAASQPVGLKPGLDYGDIIVRNGAQVTLTGRTTARGFFVVAETSRLVLNAQHLTVAWFQALDQGTVALTNAADTLDITTKGFFTSTASLNGLLTAGVIRASGAASGGSALVLGDSFVSTGTTVAMTGAVAQLVTTSGGARLQNLLIAHTGPQGPVGGATAYGVTLQAQNGATITTINGDLTLQTGQLNLVTNVYVAANLTLQAGTSLVNPVTLGYHGTFTNNGATITGNAPVLQ